MHPRILSLSAVLLIGGCITPYYRDVDYRKSDNFENMKKMSTSLAYVSGNNPVQHVVRENYNLIQARCLLISNAILVERDSTVQRNIALGAVWAGLTSGLAFANGIYNVVAKDQANAVVSSILGVAAGGTSIPTFFFFGSDKRETQLTQHLDNINSGLSRLFKLVDLHADVTVSAQGLVEKKTAIYCRKLKLELDLDIQRADKCDMSKEEREIHIKEMQERARACYLEPLRSKCEDRPVCDSNQPLTAGTPPPLICRAKVKQLTEIQEREMREKLIQIQDSLATIDSLSNEYDKKLKEINAEVTNLQTLCR